MDKYEILYQIGEGSYARVYKAFDTVNSKYVAIKKIKLHENTQQLKSIVNREISILKSLNHPNIIFLEEVIPANNAIFLVFEYLDENLLELLNRNPQGLQLAEIKNLIYQIAKAIQYCHNQNIVHRDIKPENILVSIHGQLKVCDFGFARYLNIPCQLTKYVSTRWYRAPELLVGHKYNESIDIWALGCLFFELYTGQPLFPGSNDYETLNLIVKSCGNLPNSLIKSFQNNSFMQKKLVPKTDFPSLDKKLESFNPDFKEIIKKCLTINPEDRIKIEDFIEDKIFEEFFIGITRRKRSKRTSPVRIKGNRVSISPFIDEKNEEISASFVKNKDKSLPFKKKDEKLPIIKKVQTDSLKKEFVDALERRMRERVGTKSTMKGRYLNKDISRPKYSLIGNISNENLSKFSLEGHTTNCKSRSILDKSTKSTKLTSRNFTKRNIEKLDLGNITKNMQYLNMYYSSSRRLS